MFTKKNKFLSIYKKWHYTFTNFYRLIKKRSATLWRHPYQILPSLSKHSGRYLFRSGKKQELGIFGHLSPWLSLLQGGHGYVFLMKHHIFLMNNQQFLRELMLREQQSLLSLDVFSLYPWNALSCGDTMFDLWKRHLEGIYVSRIMFDLALKYFEQCQYDIVLVILHFSRVCML